MRPTDTGRPAVMTPLADGPVLSRCCWRRTMGVRSVPGRLPPADILPPDPAELARLETADRLALAEGLADLGKAAVFSLAFAALLWLVGVASLIGEG